MIGLGSFLIVLIISYIGFWGYILKTHPHETSPKPIIPKKFKLQFWHILISFIILWLIGLVILAFVL
jgi:hypothetical protein